MRISSNATRVALVALFAGSFVASAAPAKELLVVCAPGSPGTTDEAQPTMDAFASAVGAKAGIPLTAIYEPTEAGGVARMKEAGLAIVSLPFFYKHERELGLHARLEAVQKGRPALERWVLVAQKDRVKKPDALAGFTIISNAAFAPAFVRGSVLGEFGALPANVKLLESTSVLSAMRRAANGEPIAVVLDGPQETAMALLPFASKLEVVSRSPALPAGLVVTVGDRIPSKTWSGIQSSLEGLASERTGTTTLEGIQMERFAPVDEKALELGRKAYASVP